MENQLTLFNDLKTKYHAINFEIKDVRQSNLSSSDIIESHNKEIINIHKSLAQLKQDFESNESYVSIDSYHNHSYERIIWRIDNFKEKLENAKQNDTLLNGPTLYSREYGYKLRVSFIKLRIQSYRS